MNSRIYLRIQPTPLNQDNRRLAHLADVPKDWGRFLTLYDGDERLPRARSRGFVPAKRYPRTRIPGWRNKLEFPEGTLKNWTNLSDEEVLIIYCPSSGILGRIAA